jgi:large repetitive protein
VARTILSTAVALTSLFMIGCGNSSSSPSPQPSPSITVSISPTTATALVGTAVRFTATVAGTTNTAVSYSVVEGETGGQVTSSGSYSAPSTPGTFRVRAVSVADLSRVAEATVTVRDYADNVNEAARPSDSYEYHSATLLTDGTVLVAGGFGFTGVHRAAERYLPEQNVWVGAGTLGVARMAHAATRLPDGKVLVTGGYDITAPGTSFDPALKSTEIFDPNTLQFTPGADMTVPRRNHVVTSLRDGRILITGGIQLRGSGFGAAPATEIYDPLSGTFTAKDLMMRGRWLHTATLLNDGRVLLVGGQPTNCTGAGCFPEALNTAELFDPATGSVASTGRLHVSRYAHSAALLPDGRVLIIGGETTEPLPDTDQVTTVEIYDPATGQFSDFGQLIDGRGFHALVALNNGKYLVAGGKTQSSYPAYTTEIFDPMTRTSSAGPDMTDQRIRATATKLLNGEVLIVGGNNSAQPVQPVEIYK